MSESSKCPDRRWFERLASGNVTTDQEKKLSRHLSKCKSCQSAMETQLETVFAKSTLTKKTTNESKYFQEKLSEVKSRSPSNPETTGYTDILPWLSETNGGIGRVQEFELLEFIGRGGMGVVFRCRDTRLERTVALKFMSPSLLATESAPERFVREARSAARINHPNVVTLHSVSEVGDLPFLVMEFVNGHSLEERITDSALPLSEIVPIATQITEGLAAAHKQGVLHRDIKPANIMFDVDSGQIKITDFGLACTVENSSLTRSGLLLGTPEFISPEQVAAQEIDHRSDLFSLGSVLYLMCAGKLPFSGTTLMGTLDQVCKLPHQSIAELNPQIPSWLVAIVDKLLEKQPNDRFDSAQSVLNVFESRDQSDFLVVPRPQVVTKTSSAKIRRNLNSRVVPALMAGGAFLGLLAVLFVVFQYQASWNKKERGVSNKSVMAKRVTVTNSQEFRKALEESGDLTIELDSENPFTFDRMIEIESRHVVIVGNPDGTSKLSLNFGDDPGLQLINGVLELDRVLIEGRTTKKVEDGLEALLTCDDSQLHLRRSRIVCPDSIVGVELAGAKFQCKDSELFFRDVAVTMSGGGSDELEIENSIVVGATAVELTEPQRSHIKIHRTLLITEQALYLSGDEGRNYELAVDATHNVFDSNSALIFCELAADDDLEKVSDLIDFVEFDWSGQGNCLPEVLLRVENEQGEKRLSYSSSRWSNLVSDQDETSSYEAVIYQNPRAKLIESIFERSIQSRILKPKLPKNVGPDYSRVGTESQSE